MWNFNNFGNSVALTEDNGNILTYAQLQEETAALIKNIDERCLVFSLCENTIGSIIGYVAFLNNRVVPALLNSQLDIELLKILLETYHPSYIWLPNKAAKEFPEFENVYTAYGYSLLKTNYKFGYELNDDLALLLTTSGSTGSPKFVRQSYKNIETNTKQIVEYLELDSTEKPITTLPMNYTYGCSIINTHLWVGANILLTEKTFFQKEFWNFFKENQATSFGGVPYTYEMLEKLRFFKMKLPSLRTITQAGGKLSLSLHKQLAEYAEENNKHFVVMYGACEATARMSYLQYDKASTKIGSIGKAIPNGRFVIIDTDGTTITTPEKAGELVYYGDNVTMGYATCGDDLVKPDERGGILYTGDIAKFDSDGYFYIVGRMKRFLKVFGNRVNLDEVEGLIKSNFNYIECAVGGVDDNIYIFLVDNSLSECVRKYISDITGLNPSAFKTVIIDKIPKNDAGKTLYKELTKYYDR